MIKPLSKSVLIPLGLTAAASAADAGIHKKVLKFFSKKMIYISKKLIKDLFIKKF